MLVADVKNDEVSLADLWKVLVVLLAMISGLILGLMSAFARNAKQGTG